MNNREIKLNINTDQKSKCHCDDLLKALKAVKDWEACGNHIDEEVMNVVNDAIIKADPSTTFKKHEAIKLMQQGKKVRHRNFSPNEWMTMERGSLLLEDGVRCSLTEFFMWRTDKSWDDGYLIFN